MPLESFSATQCLLSSAICLLKTADILIGHLYCDNTWKYTPIKCKKQPNCELHCGQEIHSPQLLNYIFKEILHHRKSEPRNVNHWTVIYWERFKLFLKQQNKCCSTEVHKQSSLVLQYSSKPGGFFVVPPPPLNSHRCQMQLTEAAQAASSAALSCTFTYFQLENTHWHMQKQRLHSACPLVTSTILQNYSVQSIPAIHLSDKRRRNICSLWNRSEEMRTASSWWRSVKNEIINSFDKNRSCN